ncbi:STP1 protein [Plasmodium brasilianum]|uniref:STP1 protein n=1 Tax=Plasmodium brasilianum TaxID=5824 RepID=A0ACB9YDW1_PLABR|nr:STP1 protein [Plasmodium brasilianum]
MDCQKNCKIFLYEFEIEETKNDIPLINMKELEYKECYKELCKYVNLSRESEITKNITNVNRDVSRNKKNAYHVE